MNERIRIERPEPDFREYLLGVAEKRSLIALCVAGALALGILVILISPARYSSMSMMLIYNRGVQIYQQDIVIASLPVDAAMVQNQIELLQSDKIVLDAMRSLSPEAEKLSPTDEALALRKFRAKLQVGRVSTSHAVAVVYSSADPEYSAKAANAVVQSYLRDQVISNEQAAQATSAWLKDRVKGLGANARVIAEALPAPNRDGPGRLMTLLMAGVVGLGLGIGIALVLTYLRLTGLSVRP